MLFSFILALILAVVIVTFMILNPTPVTVNLLFLKFENVSLSLVILISVLGGALFASLFGIIEQIRSSLKIRKYEKKIQEYEERLAEEEFKELKHPSGPNLL
jgi:uncharacterized integral membrane protein